MSVNNFFTVPKIQSEFDVSFGYYSRSIMDVDSSLNIAYYKYNLVIYVLTYSKWMFNWSSISIRNENILRIYTLTTLHRITSG